MKKILFVCMIISASSLFASNAAKCAAANSIKNTLGKRKIVRATVATVGACAYVATKSKTGRTASKKNDAKSTSTNQNRYAIWQDYHGAPLVVRALI